ncbi:MAG: hypothetical protein QFC55_05850, partial [Chloroflexota bacterium]|nr:hypothetical protein [Chloroflexota bacterium]
MNQPQAAVIAPPARRLNLPFLAALAIVIGAYATAFLILRALVPKDFEQMAGTVAALSLGGGAYVQRQIERRLRIPVGPVPTRAGYQKPWAVLLGVAIVAIWLAQSANPFLSLRGGPMTAVFLSVGSLLTVIAPATALVIGVVVAQRSDRWPLAVTLVAMVAGWVLAGVTYGLVIGFATNTDPGLLPPGVEMPPNPVDVYAGGGLIGHLL